MSYLKNKKMLTINLNKHLSMAPRSITGIGCQSCILCKINGKFDVNFGTKIFDYLVIGIL